MTAAQHTEPARIALVFPPLVETNFGSAFPSTAVLAAYLEREGLDAVQVDLNERFAEFLLSPAVLNDLGRDRDSRGGLLARWCQSHPDYLIEPSSGRHKFGPTSPLGFVVRELAAGLALHTDGVSLPQGSDRVVDRYRDFYASGPLDELCAGDFDLIGVSVPMGPQLLPALLLAELLKSAGTGARVVLGGPAVSLMETGDLDSLLHGNHAVDALVQYDGELPLVALARMATNGDWRPASVPGVTALIDGEVRTTKPSAGPSVRDLPAPKYDPLQLSRLDAPRLGVTQARGCYWGKCDYCDFVELYDGSPPFRGRHPGEVVDEMSALHEITGVSDFTLITESIPPAFASRFCDLLIDRGSPFTWDSFVMVDRRFTEDLMERMVKAGCSDLIVGMETVITRVLALVSKSADRDENIRFLKAARNVGLPLTVNLIPDLPSTTYAEAMDALTTLEDLSDCFNAVSIYPFEATRSSQVGRQPEKYGFVQSEGTTGAGGQAQFELNRLMWIDPAMTPQERETVHQRYQQFADMVNSGQRGVVTSQRGSCDVDTGARIAVEDMSIERADNGTVTLFDPMSRNVLRFEAGQAERVGDVLSGAPFSPTSLESRLGRSAAQSFAEKLHRLGLLTGAAAGNDTR